MNEKQKCAQQESIFAISAPADLSLKFPTMANGYSLPPSLSLLLMML